MVDIKKVYLILSGTIFLTIIGLVYGITNIDLFYNNSELTLNYWLAVIMEFVLLIVFIFTPKEIKKWILMLFVFFSGLTLSPTIYLFISHDLLNIVLFAFILTFVLFVLLSIFAMKTERDFSGIGNILMIILLVVIIAGIINLFLKLPILNLVISVVSAVLFSVFIIYDTQRIINDNIADEYDAVIELYLDILNLFVSLLNILGYGADND